MKKSISAILVAALMLIAFTACEQQVPQIPSTSHELSEVQYVSGPLTYTVGEEFDPSAYQVKLIYKDNMSPEVVSGDVYLALGAEWPTIATLEDSSARIAVKFGDKVSFYVTVYNAAVVLDITDANNEVAADAQVGDVVSTEGIVATFVCADGTTSSYDLSKVSATYAGKDKAANVKVEDGYEVAYVKDGKSVEEWTLTKAVEFGDPAKVIVEYTINDAEKPVSSVETADVYYEDTVKVAVFLADASNNKIEQLKVGDLVKIGTGNIAASYEVGAEAAGANFYYEENGKAYEGTISIPVGTDWNKTLGTPALVQGTKFTAGTGSIDADDFEISVTTASNKTEPLEDAISIIGYSEGYSLTDVKAGKVYLDLQVTYTQKTETINKIFKNIEVTVDPADPSTGTDET